MQSKQAVDDIKSRVEIKEKQLDEKIKQIKQMVKK